jgi:hypothetical protein
MFFKYTFYISCPIVFNKEGSADTLEIVPSLFHIDTRLETNSHPFQSVRATNLQRPLFHLAGRTAFSERHPVETLFTAHSLLLVLRWYECDAGDAEKLILIRQQNDRNVITIFCSS